MCKWRLSPVQRPSCLFFIQHDVEWKTPLQTSQKLNKIDTISLLEKWGWGKQATEIKIEECKESQPCEAKVHNQKPHGNQ